MDNFLPNRTEAPASKSQNRVELLKEAAQGDNTKWIEFLSRIKRNDLWIFVENKDLDFYRKFVHMVFSRQPNGVPCGDKVEVLRLSRFVENIRQGNPTFWNAVITLFFVDRDYDNFRVLDEPPLSSVYVTDYYSIENYFVCKEVLQNLLEGGIYFNKVPKSTELAIRMNYSYIINNLDTALEPFYKHMGELNKWLIYHKRKTNKHTPSEIKLNITFNWINEHEFVVELKHTDIDSLDSNYKFTVLDRIDDLSSLGDIDFCARDCIRGKFEMNFFRQYFISSVSYINSNLSEGNLQIDSGAFPAKNSIGALIDKLNTIPESLKAYLTRQFQFHLPYIDLRL